MKLTCASGRTVPISTSRSIISASNFPRSCCNAGDCLFAFATENHRLGERRPADEPRQSAALNSPPSYCGCNHRLINFRQAGWQRFTVIEKRLDHHLRHFMDVSQCLFFSVPPGCGAFRLEFRNEGPPDILIRLQDNAKNVGLHLFLLRTGVTRDPSTVAI